MSRLGTYTFVPWLRQGLANRIGAATIGQRAAVGVSLDVEATRKGGGAVSQTVNRDIALYGPGDVTGIDTAAISRIEPENWVTNFEPNYFPCMEFYKEEFLWLYTPAAPVGRRLTPWLTLIVLEDTGEFVEGISVERRPLGFVAITAALADVFPPDDELWAWAHVHINTSVTDATVDTNAARVSAAIEDVITATPDLGCARLLCPRKLKPKTGYHAFLVPSFETGRLTGLGLDPEPLFADAANGLSPTTVAWAEYAQPSNRPEPAHVPYYHRWFFRTAEKGDFESMVRLLKPRVVDPRVGNRDIDVTRPAPHIAGIGDVDLGGVLRLGGALRAPLSNLDAAGLADHQKFDTWDVPRPHRFQSDLATFLNLSDSYQTDGAAANAGTGLTETVVDDPDPLVTPPIYGRWHALTERLLEERDGSAVPHHENWVHDLNLDPRYRVAAGFGTEVIQDNQETYMEGAWDQIGEVIEANRRIRHAQAAIHSGRELHRKHLIAKAAVAPAEALLLHAPVAARVISNGVTVQHRMAQGPASKAFGSVAMRRAFRPRGRLMKKTDPQGRSSFGALFARANQSEISAALPKAPLTGTLTPDDLTFPGVPERRSFGIVLGLALSRLRDLLFVRRNVLAWLVILTMVLLLFFLGAFGWLLALGLVLLVIYAGLGDPLSPGGVTGAGSPPPVETSFTPGAVAALPSSAGFELVPDASVLTRPSATGGKPTGKDTDTGIRFKEALTAQYMLIGKSRELGAMPQLVPMDIDRVVPDIVAQLAPGLTVPRWVLSGLKLPERVRDQIGEAFVEAMAYPEFDYPMYEPLVKAGTEYFVPNLHLVASDSITLLETNQKFIEAYMVGLNHEFARELLWREYLTDQRGSYFRQFWDVRKKLSAADPDAAREALKDIRPIHTWGAASELGSHDNRETGTTPEEELVLVIRGELLKKYPNTVISAQRAKWQLKTDGTPDKAKERVLDLSEDPILPIYEARLAPDLNFFGFDLTAEVARGDDDVDDQPGWFFRLEEIPGDARFGFDVSREAGTEINVWNDLSWADVQPGIMHGDMLRIADIPPLQLIEPVDASLTEKRPQWEEDRKVRFSSDLSSAELAYVALQTPVLMAVHASELLPEPEV